MGFAYPFCELHGVWDGGGKENIADGVWKEDDGFLPDHSAFFVSHVVDLVKNNPGDFAHDFRSAVKHGP